MAKGLVLLAVAFMLDMYQGLIMLAFMGLISGASGLLAIVPVVGTAAAGAVTVGGMVLGYVIDVSLSISFGSFLLMLMALNDSLSWKAVAWGTPVELFFPFLPGWTAMVAGSLYNKNKDNSAKEQSNEAIA